MELSLAARQTQLQLEKQAGNYSTFWEHRDLAQPDVGQPHPHVIQPGVVEIRFLPAV